MWGKLSVFELETAFVVAPAADPADWIARFEKSPAFPARRWAERMVYLYNLRLMSEEVEVLEKGAPPASYRPD